MSNKELSPGPWEAQNMFNNWLIVDKNDIIIEIRGNEANAKLIAATPDMYEALNDIMALLELMPLSPHVLQAISIYERVTFKAQGGEPT